MDLAAFAGGDWTQIAFNDDKINSVLYQDILPNSQFPVVPLITADD